MTLRVIYEPKGRAREYADLAVSLYRGCDHRCAYCYSPNVLKMKREEFGTPTMRQGVIAKLTLDAIDLEEAGNTRSVLLSFTHDPYMLMDALLGERYGTEHSLTRQAIRILKHHGQRVSILTKGGLRATRDLDLLGEHDAFGCTLTFAAESDSREWEPGAAMPSDRIEVLKQAHARGIPTWASIEPVIDPGQSVAMILASLPYVDEYRLGAWNYDKRANDTDWPAYYRRVQTLLRGEGKRVVVKADLLERALIGCEGCCYYAAAAADDGTHHNCRETSGLVVTLTTEQYRVGCARYTRDPHYQPGAHLLPPIEIKEQR